MEILFIYLVHHFLPYQFLKTNFHSSYWKFCITKTWLLRFFLFFQSTVDSTVCSMLCFSMEQEPWALLPIFSKNDIQGEFETAKLETIRFTQGFCLRWASSTFNTTLNSAGSMSTKKSKTRTAETLTSGPVSGIAWPQVASLAQQQPKGPCFCCREKW